MALSIPIIIHNALWKAFEDKQSNTVALLGKTFKITYQDNYQAHRARIVVGGTIWESQNMRKASANTKKVVSTPGYRLSWGFQQNPGRGIKWQNKVSSQDTGDIRKIVVWDLQQYPNQVVNSFSIPLNEVS